jgi:hypothetical protein
MDFQELSRACTRGVRAIESTSPIFMVLKVKDQHVRGMLGSEIEMKLELE